MPTNDHRITIEGLNFRRYISHRRIQKRLTDLAHWVDHSYAADEPLVLLAVLSGSFRIAADLVTKLRRPVFIEFIRAKSYDGLNSSGEVSWQLPAQLDLAGKHVLVIEDIIDSGLTMHELILKLNSIHCLSIKVATLLLKKDCLKHAVPEDWVGFYIPDLFVIGYGLGLNGRARELNAVYPLA